MVFKFRTSSRERAGNRFVYQVLRELASAVIYEKKRSGLTQREIANRMGIDKSEVGRILKGEATLTLRTVGEFLWALGWEPKFSARPKKATDANHVSVTSTTRMGKFVTDSECATDSTITTFQDSVFKVQL